MAKQSSRGQILEREYGFLVRVFVERDPVTGQRKYVNQKVRSTRKKDAEQVLTALLRKQDLGENLLATTPMTVREYLDYWLDEVASQKVTERTLVDYRWTLHRYVCKDLGNKKLMKLNSDDLQQLYSKMLKPKDQGGLGVTPRTVIYTHRTLSTALKHGVRTKRLGQNVCQLVELPKRQRKEMNAMNETELKAFLEAASTSPCFTVFSLMLGTGLRPGEVLARQWEDFDPMTGTLSIQRALQSVKGKQSFKQPKTSRSRRPIKLPDDLTRELLDHRANALFKSDLLFPSANNTPLDIRNFDNRYFKPVLEKAGLGHYVSVKGKDGKERQRFVAKFRLYDLRHSHATMLLKAGIHAKIVSERLGHSTITLTLDTYSQVLPGMQDEAASKLNAMLPFRKQNEQPRVVS
jgi:integrase